MQRERRGGVSVKIHPRYRHENSAASPHLVAAIGTMATLLRGASLMPPHFCEAPTVKEVVIFVRYTSSAQYECPSPSRVRMCTSKDRCTPRRDRTPRPTVEITHRDRQSTTKSTYRQKGGARATATRNQTRNPARNPQKCTWKLVEMHHTSDSLNEH